jgi:hypothetical protein
MKKRVLVFWIILYPLLQICLFGQDHNLLDRETLRLFINESSGEMALKDAAEISKYDRLPASPGFKAAAQFVADKAKEYGLSDVQMESFPADGKTYYNSFLSDPSWTVKVAELWINQPLEERLASYAEENLSLGWYSRSADVTAPLVNIGRGMQDADYEKVDVKGKIVLTTGSPETVLNLAVKKRGAEGIIFYSAGSRGFTMNPRRISWSAFFAPPEKGFLFVLTYEKGNELATRLRSGENIVLRARVETEVGPGEYQVVSGIIPGADLKHEILFNAHLDHPTPSANDDAAGCAVLLDMARVWTKLIREGKVPPPQRTVRFIWQAEMSGSMTYVARHPELVEKTLAGIRFGVIGGEISKTKSIYNLYRSRNSAPTFISDLAEEMMEAVLSDSIWWLPTPLPLRIQAPSGSRDVFYMKISNYFGEDDYTYDDSTTGFPHISFNGAPDVNRHTSEDSIDKLDPTQIKRSAFLGLSVGWLAAMAVAQDVDWIANEVFTRGLGRLGTELRRAESQISAASPTEIHFVYREALANADKAVDRENLSLQSIQTAYGGEKSLRFYSERTEQQRPLLHAALEHAYQIRCVKTGVQPGQPQFRPKTELFRSIVPRRRPEVRGPMFHWNKDYLVQKLGEEIYAKTEFYKRRWWPSMGTEALNFVDGKRSVLDIRDEISFEFEPIPVETLFGYLELLKRTGVIEW